MDQAYQIVARLARGEDVEIPAVWLSEFFSQAVRLPDPLNVLVSIDSGIARLARAAL